jgi:photosystem II stability/assembly factor-like uncharacterized protein
MKQKIILYFFTFFSVIVTFGQLKPISTVVVDTLLSQKISIRALLIDKQKAWFSANNNRFGYVDIEKGSQYIQKIKVDSLEMEFRSIAQTPTNLFCLSTGNPAVLYKISKKDLNPKLVYSEIDKKVFYDSMQFSNTKFGIALGDPMNGCLSLIVTNDGGSTWKKIPCSKLPQILEGESVFASSNSNVIIKKQKIWLVTGGKYSRVFYSPNLGKTWTKFITPMINGKAMTGTFTADFYDENIGIISGGDYENPTQNFGNKAITTNGGKTWKLVGENLGHGYASCIQFVPKSKGKQLVSVGLTGLFVSNDFAKTWTKLLDDTTLYTIRFLDSKTAIASGKNQIVKLSFK